MFRKKKLNYEDGAVYCWKLRNFEIQKNKSEKKKNEGNFWACCGDK